MIILIAGTRRIEATAGLSCVEWYRKAYEPIPKALQLLRANGTNEIIDKLEKSLQQTKDLQKRVEFMNEKLATAGEVVIEPISSKIKGNASRNIFRSLYLTMVSLLDVDVKIHLIDSDLDANFMQKRANVLKESQSDAAHILVNGNTIVVALNGKQIKSETANSVSIYKYCNFDRLTQYQCLILQILKQMLKHIKGGGGGQKEMAQGRLAEAFTNEADIISKLVPALEKC